MILVSLTLLTGIDEIMMIVRSIDPLFLMGLFLLQIFTLSMVSYQWYFMFKNTENEISFHEVFTIHMAGKFVESVTPSSKFGGETAKVYLFKKKMGKTYQNMVSYLLAHKFISLLPFLVLSLIFLVIASIRFYLPSVVYLSFSMLIFLFISLLILIYWKKVRFDSEDIISDERKVLLIILNKLKKGIEFISRSANDVKKILSRSDRNKLFAISFLVWILYPVKVYLVATALGFEVGLIISIIATYSAYLVSMLPVSPGGLGTFEGTMATVFMISELSFTEGMAIALLARSATFLFPLILSAVCTTYLVKIDGLKIFSIGDPIDSH